MQQVRFQGEKTFAIHLLKTAQDFANLSVSCACRGYAAIRHFGVFDVHIKDIGLKHFIGF